MNDVNVRVLTQILSANRPIAVSDRDLAERLAACGVLVPAALTQAEATEIWRAWFDHEPESDGTAVTGYLARIAKGEQQP